MIYLFTDKAQHAHEWASRRLWGNRKGVPKSEYRLIMSPVDCMGLHGVEVIDIRRFDGPATQAEMQAGLELSVRGCKVSYEDAYV